MSFRVGECVTCSSLSHTEHNHGGKEEDARWNVQNSHATFVGNDRQYESC